MQVATGQNHNKVERIGIGGKPTSSLAEICGRILHSVPADRSRASRGLRSRT
jgi:hypothetical protein